jgi:hypothetical protein
VRNQADDDAAEYVAEKLRRAIAEVRLEHMAREHDLVDLVERYSQGRLRWNRAKWGEPPGSAHCVIPTHILREGGWED